MFENCGYEVIFKNLRVSGYTRVYPERVKNSRYFWYTRKNREFIEFPGILPEKCLQNFQVSLYPENTRKNTRKLVQRWFHL